MKNLKNIAIFALFAFCISCASTKNTRLPIYPGCDKCVSMKENDDCFKKSISRHVVSHFNVEFAKYHNIPSGTQLKVLFEVDEIGKVNILSVYTSYEILKQEILRVFKKLPLMKPARSKGKPVRTQFILPVKLIFD